MKTTSIAVLLPALNEASNIASVIRDFQKALPEAVIYVYDNHSTDNTSQLASKAGALVRQVSQRGKGNVMAAMFAEVDADLYVLCDADGTYDTSTAPGLVERLLNHQLDVVIGSRQYASPHGERPLHIIGNRALSTLVSWVYSTRFSDMLSGYRVMTQRYVRSFPCLSTGFSVETEMNIHIAALRIPFAELPVPYLSRKGDSNSKIQTFRDGFRILKTIIQLTQAHMPFLFFFCLSIIFALTSLWLAAPVITEYLETGLVPRFPTAILAASFGLLAFTSLVTGIISSATATLRKEVLRFQYLNAKKP